MKKNVPLLTVKYAPEGALEDMEVAMAEAQGDMVVVESMVDTEAKEVQVDMVEEAAVARNAVLFPVNRVKMFQDNLVIQYLAKFQNSPVNRFPDNPVNLFLVSNVNPFHAKNAGQCHLKNAKTFRLRYAVEVAVLEVVAIAAQAADEDTRAEVDTAIMAKIPSAAA